VGLASAGCFSHPVQKTGLTGLLQVSRFGKANFIRFTAPDKSGTYNIRAYAAGIDPDFSAALAQ
jgi:hypothetical protein